MRLLGERAASAVVDWNIPAITFESTCVDDLMKGGACFHILSENHLKVNYLVHFQAQCYVNFLYEIFFLRSERFQFWYKIKVYLFQFP